MSDERCSSCGARLSPDADWCGLCLTPITARSGPASGGLRQERSAPGGNAGSAARLIRTTVRPSEDGTSTADPAAAPVWACPSCDTENPLELNVCTACGTSFASLMRRDERPRAVDPMAALRWSLLFPGLGHRAVGRGGDGLARAVVFAMTFGLGLVALSSGTSSGAAGAVGVVFGLFGVLVYAGTAYEAYHLARGGALLLSARAVLWIVVAILMLSALLLALLVTVAAHGAASP